MRLAIKALFEKLRGIAKTIFIVIVVSTITTIGFYKVINYFFPLEILKPDSTWIETIGTITKIGYGRSGVGLIDYNIGDKSYRGRRGRNHGLVLGEKYILVINPKKPDQYLEKYWNPIFLENEPTEHTHGVVSRVYRMYAFPDSSDEYGTDYGVEYSYLVDGIEYERKQSWPQSWKIEQRIKKGDSCDVEYLIANPQRAALRFDTLKTF